MLLTALAPLQCGTANSVPSLPAFEPHPRNSRNSRGRGWCPFPAPGCHNGDRGRQCVLCNHGTSGAKGVRPNWVRVLDLQSSHSTDSRKHDGGRIVSLDSTQTSCPPCEENPSCTGGWTLWIHLLTLCDSCAVSCLGWSP